MQLLIKPDGGVRCLYDETLDLQGLGQLQIERGSHVEPDADGQWTADLSPVAGPLLGPFPTPGTKMKPTLTNGSQLVRLAQLSSVSFRVPQKIESNPACCDGVDFMKHRPALWGR